MKDSPYHKQVVLQKDLVNVECWNCTDGTTGTIPAGTTIEVSNVNDATTTTIQVVSGPALMSDEGLYEPQLPCCSVKVSLGLPLNTDEKVGGHTRLGYRFIVPNTVLNEAIGRDLLPPKTRDIVGDMMRFEDGQMGEDEARELLTDLRDTGTLRSLQGAYGRAAAACPSSATWTTLLNMPIDETHTTWTPFTADFDYYKKFYDVKLPDGTIVEQCWPNSGFMCAINGDNRKFSHKDNVEVRISVNHPMDDE